MKKMNFARVSSSHRLLCFTFIAFSILVSGCGGGGGGYSSTSTSVGTTNVGSGTSGTSSGSGPLSFTPPTRYTPITHNTPTQTTFGTGYRGSLSPSDLLVHYSFPITTQGSIATPTYPGTGQTIVIIDGPGGTLQSITSDLAQFNTYYNLPPCNFQLIDQSGGLQSASGYQEIAMDVEWAHAMAPGAKIVLIKTADNYMTSVMDALQAAVQQPNVVAISMSFGASEFTEQTNSSYDGFFKQYPGIAFLAAAGDYGGNQYSQNYPAASPYVTGVGGTSISGLAPPSNSNLDEQAWIDGGGGPSAYELMPGFQTNYMIALNDAILKANAGMRAVPDVSYNADPLSSPVAVVVNGTWSLFGGTSASTPQWAAIMAGLAQYMGYSNYTNLLKNAGGLNPILYQLAINHSNSFYNVTTGRNGTCALCTAATNYNDATGLGVPVVANFYANFSSYAH